jgi:RNA polymerase sigma-70 factor (sigma-E family)
MAVMGPGGLDAPDAPEKPADAVARLFREQYSVLVGLGVVLTGDRELATDLVQEAFGKLLGNWNRLRDRNAALAYLRSTLVNSSRSTLRRRLLIQRTRPFSEDNITADPVERIVMMRALRSLPNRQRVCVALRFYEGLRPDEVAQVMNTSVGTVKSQTHKALRRLQRLLEE